MNRCVICYSPHLNQYWTRYARGFVCSFDCFAVKQRYTYLGIAFFSLVISLITEFTVFSKVSGLGIPIIFGLIFGGIIIYEIAIYFHGQSLVEVKYNERKKWMEAERNSKRNTEKRISLNSTAPSSTAENNKIKVSALGMEFEPCCYQTARIGDQYCICGKAVNQKLIDHLNLK